MMQLSERQQQIVAAALVCLSALVVVSIVLGIFWLLASFVSYFSNVLLPLVVAGIAALVFQPYFDWLQTKLRLPATVALVVLFLSILVPIAVFVGFFGVVLVREAIDFCQQIPVWWEQGRAQLESQMPALKAFFTEHPMGRQIGSMLQGQGPMIAKALESVAATSVSATSHLAGWSSAMLSWAVAPVYFAFFLLMKRKDVSDLGDYLPFLKEGTRNDVVFLANEFVNIVVSFFRGQIIIAFLQGVLLSIGFSVVGLKYGLVLGMLLGFLNVIPYLGSMLGLLITLPLAYFQDGGGVLLLLGVIVVLSIVQTIEGYILTPKIMGDRTGLSPMVIIFAVFFWGSALGGILGLILAIPLTAFLVVCWRLAKRKYITELV